MNATLDTILQDMALQETQRNDLDIPLNALIMRSDGKIKSSIYGEFIPSKTAINKLCSMYKLSPSHINTLMSAGRLDIVADTFNHFLLQDRKTMKLRLIGDRIKGIVGKNYKPFDNYDLFSITNNYLKENKLESKIEVVSNDDEYTRIRFALPDTGLDMGATIKETTEIGDIVQGGFEITNSEIGMKSMGLNTLLYRLICSNGMMEMISNGDNEEIFYKRGDNFNPFSEANIINQTLTNIVDQSFENINNFKKTKEIIVKDPVYEIRKISNKYNLNTHVDKIRENFQHEPQSNYYGIVNSITRTARDVDDYRQKSKLEFVAHNVVKQVALV